MKHQRSAAFTLIEMLTVITIIGLLIALLFPTIKMALRKGEIAQARIEIKTIVHAVQVYYNEYGFLPCTMGNTITTSGPLFVYDVKYNPRSIVFLTPPTRKGALASDGTLQDPWGFAYQVQFDCMYTSNVPFVVYSYGPNATGSADSQSIYSNQ